MRGRINDDFPVVIFAAVAVLILIALVASL